MKCALDLREEEFRREGYLNLNGKKAYVRLGRAIFTIQTEPRKVELAKTLETPIGMAIAITGQTDKLTEEMVEKINEIFLPTGYLKITVEGDPDSGVSSEASTILISGYRFGLDDIIINGKTLVTTHGDHYELIENLIDTLERELEGKTLIFANHTEKAKKNLKKARERIKKIFKQLRELVITIKENENDLYNLFRRMEEASE